MKRRRQIIMAILVLSWVLLVLYKVVILGVQPKDIIPVSARQVTLNMSFTAHGDDLSIKTFVPTNSTRQEIEELDIQVDGLEDGVKSIGKNRVLTISGDRSKGKQSAEVSWLVRTKVANYLLPKSMTIADYSKNSALNSYLQATDMVQSESGDIAELCKYLSIDTVSDAITTVRKSFSFAYDSLAPAKFSAKTDALLALKLREASCNGKSRLFVAMNRHCGIPARLVGGLVMKNGTKRTTHQWAELYLGGEWIPFDPLNGHFAMIPDNYLQLYIGDEPMFVRSSNINFAYHYKIEKIQVSRKSTAITKSSIFNTARLWELFDEAGIPLTTLRILLMIPLGAIIIIIFRNVIGVHTFGTFLPVLIATSMRETGLLWGMIIFSSVIFVGIFVRQFLERYRLLHSPKLTIILVSVIVSLITLTVIGIKTGHRELLSASMFPLAILAITTERFCTVIESSGLKKAITIFLWTLLVVTFCYISMLSILIQSIVMVFPETLLLIVALSIYLGSWNSLRLIEFLRFRKIIFGSEAAQ